MTTKPTHRDYQPGYEPVLVRADTRAMLRAFRIRHFGSDSHIERCMVSAALSLVLSEPALQHRLLEGMKEAVRADISLSLNGKGQSDPVFHPEPLANGGG